VGIKCLFSKKYAGRLKYDIIILINIVIMIVHGGVIELLKTISAMKARQNLGQIMNEVSIRSDRYIIERNGKPLVAIVPVSFIEEQELKKKEFLDLLDKAQNNSNISEDDIQSDIQKAIREVRNRT